MLGQRGTLLCLTSKHIRRERHYHCTTERWREAGADVPATPKGDGEPVISPTGRDSAKCRKIPGGDLHMESLAYPSSGIAEEANNGRHPTKVIRSPTVGGSPVPIQLDQMFPGARLFIPTECWFSRHRLSAQRFTPVGIFPQFRFSHFLDSGRGVGKFPFSPEIIIPARPCFRG